MLKQLYIFLLIVGNSIVVQAQVPELHGAHTQWSNSFGEWNIASINDEQFGSLERNYPAGNNWTSWTIQYNSYSGTIKQKWNNQPHQWELRYANQLVTMRPVFRNDFTSWRIEGNEKTITWVKQFRNLDAPWAIRQYPGFTIYTELEGDPRGWIIEDSSTSEKITISMKLAMVFITLYYSSPKQ